MTGCLRALRWIVLTVLIAVALFEAALQLGALLLKDQTRQVEARWLSGNTRILALGDSNTYGFYLDAADAWPAQLQRQWNEHHPDQPVEVLNLGYPGTNSFRVRDTLPGLLDTLSPDIVLIMVGFNDFWTPIEDTAASTAGITEWIKTHSRVYRLYCIATRSRVSQQDLHFGASRDPMAPVDTANIAQHLVQVDNERFYLGTRQGEPARHRHALVDNLTHMISLVRARGAQVYLLTYPSHWGFYPGANQRLKEAAGINKAPLIDITPLFIARCPDGPPSCQDLLFHDGHATAQGNALVAETIQTFLHARWPAIQDSSSAVP